MPELGNNPIFTLFLTGNREINIYYNGHVEGCDDLIGIANHIDFAPLVFAPVIPEETARDRAQRVLEPYEYYFSKSRSSSVEPTKSLSNSISSTVGASDGSRAMEPLHLSVATGENR